MRVGDFMNAFGCVLGLEDVEYSIFSSENGAYLFFYVSEFRFGRSRDRFYELYVIMRAMNKSGERLSIGMGKNGGDSFKKLLEFMSKINTETTVLIDTCSAGDYKIKDMNLTGHWCSSQKYSTRANLILENC